MSADLITNWAVETGIAITCLIGFILIIRRPFARRFGAGAAYALWALPLIRLFMPPINIPILKPGIDTANAHEIIISAEIIRNMAALDTFTPLTTPPPSLDVNWLGLAVIVWGGIAAVWLIKECLRQSQYVKNLRRNSRPLDGASLGAAKNAATKSGFKSLPNIRVSTTHTGPLVTGILRPVIILPHNFAMTFTAEQQEMTLLHELSHIKRRDLWAAFAALTFRALNWPNPLVHFAAHRFRADQEAACDATVLRIMGGKVESTRTYAETLLQAATAAQQLRPAPVYNMPMGLTIYHPLKERLMMMTATTRKTTLMSRLAAGTLIASAIALTAPLSLAGQQNKDEMAGKPHERTMSKRVIKSVEDVDGVKTKTHYEIVTKDGVTTAYSIDKKGKKTKIDPATIKTKHGHVMTETHSGPHNMDVMVMRGSDGMDIEKHIKIITEDEMGSPDGQHKKVIVRTMKDGQDMSGKNVQVYAFSSSDDVHVDIDGKGHHMSHGAPAKAMVSAAHDLIDNLDDDKFSDKTKRKLEKARKALKDAQDAIAAEK